MRQAMGSCLWYSIWIRDVVIGSSVILLDPVFRGLVISLMAGEIASTFLSRVAVPVLYYVNEQRKETSSSPGVCTTN